MDGDLCVIIPTFGQIEYAAAAVESLFRSTPRAWACVVDDASPNWESEYAKWLAPVHESLPSRLQIVTYPINGGLTRSWNRGLNEAKLHGAAYSCCTNSDVLFSRGWDAPLLECLDTTDYSLVGPVSNAPGYTARGAQDIVKYVKGYRLTDDREYLDRVAADLRRSQADRVLQATINGFCMVGRTNRWHLGAFEEQNVFSTAPKYRMSGNEDELQRRWAAKGWRAGVVPASFVFHYRAVTRGDAHRRGRWFRPGMVTKEKARRAPRVAR